MIIVVHNTTSVTKILNEQQNELSFAPQQSIAATLFHLANAHPASLLIWCDARYLELLDINSLKRIFHHKRIMASHSIANKMYLPVAIGYVEDSPFVTIPYDVTYPTWQMSSDMGGIFSEVLNCIKEHDFESPSFEYFLNSVAKTAQRSGLLCYSEPRLKHNSPLVEKGISDTLYPLFSFVQQHYKSRWLFVLLLNCIVFEKKFPLLPFLGGLLKTKRNTYNIDLSEIHVTSKAEGTLKRSVDVIIPTMGRPGYLHTVLKDLAAQTLLPEKVIIVEQNTDTNSVSALRFITEGTWPFVIQHHFIHQSGACNARNVALKDVTGEWVFMADDDIEFQPDLLENVFAFLQNYRCKATTLSCLRKGETAPEPHIRQWNSFGSGCSVVHSSFAKKIQYDLAFEHGYGEDKEYGMQLRKAGCDILYNPNTTLLHIKAPVGGFRAPAKKAWQYAEIEPKPSPTVMLFYLNNASKQQVKGYKMQLFLKFFSQQAIKNPFRYISQMKKRWNSSINWAKQLDRS